MSLIKETGKILIKTGLSLLFRIKKNGYSMRFYPTKISLVLWVDSFYGRSTYSAEEQFFRDYLHEGDVFCDIGANIGLYTLVAAITISDSGRVYAVEAHPKIYGYLLGNIRINKLTNVQTHDVALGDENKVMQFSNKKRDDETVIAFNGSGIFVNMTRLDNLDIRETILIY